MTEASTPAEAEFERAWKEERYTRVELPPVDVNRVLAQRYTTKEPLALTRAQLWDMEVRKAGDPGAFIPYVVREGSAAAWVPGRPGAELGDEFVRRSEQKLWLRPEEYGLVLEEVSLNHEQQIVTFIGRSALADAQGEPLAADTRQPVFHVQHGVAGSEDQPANTWRIVLLTEAHDDRFVEFFDGMAAEVWLPGFIENYIRYVLRVPLERRGVA
ncbi:hypothetical protein DEJ50_08935 [Streptomyces venezuelae]|uniref:Uncharacterized protein n=1 Tax=Streptomyces venezuelae TaxID=54571 RepID=A0A5P2CYH2_STRVZ|nr:hypothetical protein [Streptomyces venezuelae]QES47915.1 hypothetical protein DEJ50_08935 [Streptomyces venezuelae]